MGNKDKSKAKKKNVKKKNEDSTNSKKKRAPKGFRSAPDRALALSVPMEVKRQHTLSRRDVSAALDSLADELITLCPFSTSPDDVSDALGRFADDVRALAEDVLSQGERRDRAAELTAETES